LKDLKEIPRPRLVDEAAATEEEAAEMTLMKKMRDLIVAHKATEEEASLKVVVD
jgi:hypothetical protein